MFLSYFTLFVALSLSAVAAWYSIIGLTAIFAAAVVPIIIMGGILEVAKITITVWLHEYWHRCRLLMKLYLVPAVVLLMIITSMGIFGFLSKAHLDQAVPTGDVQAQVALFDEKLQTQRDNIATARAAIQQMDNQVNERLTRSDDDRGAERAVQIRRQQARERAALQADIAQAQAEIAALNQQRAPVAAELRKVEAEVGPIKYIAALIYGNDPDANLLEKAVRWVIILLVVVFDPLAIMMVLAATESLKWHREQKSSPSPAYDSDDGPLTEQQLEEIQTAVDEWKRDNQSINEHEPGVSPKSEKSIAEQHPYLTKEFVHFEPTPPRAAPVPDHNSQFLDDETLFEPLTENNNADTDRSFNVDPTDTVEVAAEKIAKRDWKEQNPNDTLHRQERLHRDGKINQLPWQSQIDQMLGLRADETTQNADFGTQFPKNANKGDVFIRVDYLPTKLYKWNSTKWIEIDKNITDSFVYNDGYIQHLISKLASGEYDPELLTASEQAQIEQQLNIPKENND
jgi:hypothetical protein